MIGWQHFGPQLETQHFARCVREIAIAILVFHFRLLPRKTNITKFFKKSKILFWAHSRPFCPNLGKNEFSRKKWLCQFLNIRIIYHCAKKQLCLMSHSWENCWTDITKTSLIHLFLCEIQPILESCEWLKNLAIWLTKRILDLISGTRIFPNMKFVQAYSNYNNTNFHYRPNWDKIKELRKKTKLSHTFKEP